MIKKLRVNKELTQAQLAEACQVRQGTVAQWENGICFPKADKFPALARVLECDIGILLKMAEDRKKVGA